LLAGTDVSASIRALAAHRPDIFGTGTDDDARREAEAIASAQSKAREKVVWDGHTASKEAITNRFAGASLDEQIEALHRAKGLVG
jgi:splicing factor 3A subunit 1